MSSYLAFEKQLVADIETLRSKLNMIYMDDNVDRETLMILSQKLDKTTIMFLKTTSLNKI